MNSKEKGIDMGETEEGIGVLLLHGILERPDVFGFLMDHLSSRFPFQAPILPGHGSDSKAFSKAKRVDWEEQVESEAMALAKGKRKLVVVGHSLGALLAIRLAKRHPEWISGLVLIDCPLVARIPWDHLGAYLTVGLTGRLPKTDDAVSHEIEALGVGLPKTVFGYLTWIRPFWGLWKEIRLANADYPHLTCPILVYHSIGDELVSHRSVDKLGANPNATVCLLTGCTHAFLTEEAKSQIEEGLNRLLKTQG